MTRIDFYIIEDKDKSIAVKTTDTFICRLTAKAWSQNNAIYVHTNSEKHAIEFDELLWTYNEDSFIPHQLVQNDNNEKKRMKINFTLRLRTIFMGIKTFNLSDFPFFQYAFQNLQRTICLPDNYDNLKLNFHK